LQKSAHKGNKKSKSIADPAPNETFEKCQFLFKFKKGDNFNHRNTLSISRINPPKIGGGLKFEPDAGIEQKGVFCKGLKL
jgi:hypothetical protein